MFLRIARWNVYIKLTILYNGVAGMGMSIKNAEVERLARKLAKARKVSLTEAIRLFLQEAGVGASRVREIGVAAQGVVETETGTT